MAVFGKASGGLNLHALVRPVINALHPEVTATLYRSMGQKTGADGMIRSAYAPGVTVNAQMQSEGASALYHTDHVGMEEVVRKFYLFSPPELDLRVAGIVRPLSRGGDVFELEAPLGAGPTLTTWWLVDAVLEDFTRTGGGRQPGWVSVRATLQVTPPWGKD